ncbi:19349_t:CDS:2 [Dentiscutata erythropus]|uniref:19349_t:CDS:1 n=1 Tax=Dentiscutata erythropus TaxID=1348616 RepID=A0A9N9BR62_9GLOM|nr:19349_t:CDS:2 [Dentiscutata erythropus]
MFVLQFANGGDLRSHLKAKHEEGHYKILWTELIGIAKAKSSEGVNNTVSSTLLNTISNSNKHEKIQITTFKDDGNSSTEQVIMSTGANIYNYEEFDFIEKIGEGGFGQVEKAYWKNKDKPVALKSLKVKMHSSKNIIKELIRE